MNQVRVLSASANINTAYAVFHKCYCFMLFSFRKKDFGNTEILFLYFSRIFSSFKISIRRSTVCHMTISGWYLSSMAWENFFVSMRYTSL